MNLLGNSFTEVFSYDGSFTGLLDADGDVECCCEADCDCSVTCAAPNWRLTWAGVNCPPSNDPAICEIVCTYTGTFTEGDPTLIPGDQPCSDASAALRYWTADLINIDCSVLKSFLMELACCTIGGGPQLWFRVDGGPWCLITPEGYAETCDQVWSHANIGATIGTDTAAGGCGTPVLDIWCDGSTPQAQSCFMGSTGQC